MNNNNNNVTFIELLFITFLVLKLTHVIDWSWFWVFSPLWSVVALAVIVGVFKGLSK